MKSAATDATTFPVATSCTSRGGTRFRKHGSGVLGKDRHSDHHATRSGDGTWSVGRQLDFAVTCTRAPVDRSEPESEFETEPASVSGDGFSRFVEHCAAGLFGFHPRVYIVINAGQSGGSGGAHGGKLSRDVLVVYPCRISTCVVDQTNHLLSEVVFYYFIKLTDPNSGNQVKESLIATAQA